MEELNTRHQIQDSLDEGFTAGADAPATTAGLTALHEALNAPLAAGDPAVELMEGT